MRLIDADKIVYSWQIDADGQEHDGIALQSSIDKMPTIEERKKGRWIYGEDGMLHCSECEHIPCNRIIVNGITVYNLTLIKEKMKYCPVCGTRMMG